MENGQNSIYEVSLADAKQWVGAYLAGKPADTTRAFLIDADELQNIVDQKGAAYVRVYFGLNTSLPEHPEKLLLVPCDEMGRDMINTKNPDHSNIYDFTMPCPPTCDFGSPLCPPAIIQAEK